MALQRDVKVIIQEGGIGRLPIGKDYYTGLIFQNATLPTGFAVDDRIKRIYSIIGAEDLGITEALFPVEHYHISEYFRILEKFNINGFLDVGIYAIGLGAFDGSEITLMQNNANGDLRQIGVYLVDAYASTFITGANAKAEALNVDGYPVSIYLAADHANYSLLVDLRVLDSKWVSTIISQDGAGKGNDLYISEGYSITTIGAILAITAVAEVQQRIGNMRIPFDLSGITELQTLALADGTLISTITDTEIDTLTDQGYTLLLKRRITGSYIYVDAMTASAETSDYIEQRFNRVVGKAKRYLLEEYQIIQNSEIYVDPDTGRLSSKTISDLETIGLDALNKLAISANISFDQNTGRVPRKSIQINPDQNVLQTDKIEISAKIVPVGSVSELEISLSLTTSIS